MGINARYHTQLYTIKNANLPNKSRPLKNKTEQSSRLNNPNFCNLIHQKWGIQRKISRFNVQFTLFACELKSIAPKVPSFDAKCRTAIKGTNAKALLIATAFFQRGAGYCIEETWTVVVDPKSRRTDVRVVRFGIPRNVMFKSIPQFWNCPWGA